VEQDRKLLVKNREQLPGNGSDLTFCPEQDTDNCQPQVQQPRSSVKASIGDPMSFQFSPFEQEFS